MNLKYYLRGLGIGIAMTTIIIGLGVERPVEKLTDEQIKARAAELGMVEAGGRLSDLVSETPSPEAKKENTEETKETAKPTKTPKVEAREEVKETEKLTETPKSEAEEATHKRTVVVFCRIRCHIAKHRTVIHLKADHAVCRIAVRHTCLKVRTCSEYAVFGNFAV